MRREMAISLQNKGETMALIGAKERSTGKLREARVLLEESLKIYADMKTNNQFYGADNAKITALNAFIEKYEQEFSR